MIKTVLVALVGLAGSLASQQSQLVVPHQYTAMEAPSLRRVAGFAADVRQQILVSHDHLAALRGRSLSGLTFRRDRGLRAAFESGWVALSITVSTTPKTASTPSNQMDENVGSDAVLVFSGKILLPSSGILDAEVSLWDARCTAHIPFTQSFPYSGGDLCIEIRPVFGGSVTGIGRWPVDAAKDQHLGTVESVSTSCSSFIGAPVIGSQVIGSQGRPSHAESTVARSQLVLGQSVLFGMRGTPGAVALFLLGPRLAPSLNLAAFGSPGCTLDVQPTSSLIVTAFTPQIAAFAPEVGGRANATLEVTPSTSLLGMQFYCQWVDMGPPIMTSNTLRVTISSDVPTLGMSIVSAPYVDSSVPAIGHVSIDVGQVMRLDSR